MNRRPTDALNTRFAGCRYNGRGAQRFGPDRCAAARNVYLEITCTMMREGHGVRKAGDFSYQLCALHIAPFLARTSD